MHDSILLEAYYCNAQELWFGLCRIEEYMNPTLHYNGQDFTIGTDFTAGYDWSEESMKSLHLDKRFGEELAEIEARR